MIDAQTPHLLSSLVCAEKGLRQIPLNRQFELLHQSGIQSLEIGLGSAHPSHFPTKPSEEEFETLNTLRQKYGIQTCFTALETDLTRESDTEVHPLLENMIEGLKTTSRIGAHTVNLSITATPTIEVGESNWNSFTSALRELSAAAKELELQLNLMTEGWVENQNSEGLFMVETIMTNRNALKDLLSTLPKNTKIGYAPGMFKAVNPSDLRFARDILQDHIGITVLQDWEPRDRLIREAVIGTDDLDYQPFIKDASPDSPLLLSVPPHTDPAKAIGQSLTYLSRISKP